VLPAAGVKFGGDRAGGAVDLICCVTGETAVGVAVNLCVYERPEPGIPAAICLPRVPTVYQRPRLPNERLAFFLPRFKRIPGIRDTDRLNRHPIMTPPGAAI
jgi:hypothetical protein